jgi:Xaa-Pro aminopeptidase
LDIANYIHTEFKRRGVGSAWEWEYCPIVNCGPDSPVGHAGPSSQYVTKPGQIVHIDMGVTENDYVSDIQRLWYFAPKGESIPEPVQRAFATIRAAIETAVKILKPGVKGWEVDAAARKTLTDAGYPEYQHALGHHIGRTTHDGGTLLGPRWERYGKTPEGLVEAGNVYTIEPSLFLPGYGMIAVEEDVLITDNGLQWLSAPQTEIIVVPV